jgi:hypothetical protein
MRQWGHEAVGMGQWAWGMGQCALGNGHGYVEDIYVSIRICIYTNIYKPYLDEDVDVY